MEAIGKDELVSLIDNAAMRFVGNIDELENAIGALMFGRMAGWRPLFLIHTQKSIKKYEAILGIDFRSVMPEVGPKAEKLVAWQIAQKVSNFWKLVKGEVPNVRTDDWKYTK